MKLVALSGIFDNFFAIDIAPGVYTSLIVMIIVAILAIIVGVMARKFPIIDDWSEGIVKNGNPNNTEGSFDVLYAKPDDPDIANGRIMKTSAPVVLAQAFMEDSSYGNSIGESRIRMIDARASGFNSALMAYCQAVYEISSGSMNSASAQMAIGFRDVDGRMILPGNTCRFVSREGTDDGKDKVIYYGYIRNVVHHMSTGGGCSTTINMSYIRPDEEYKIDGNPVIEDGNVNAAYGELRS